MRRPMHLKAWWRVPCSGRKCLRTESQKDIAEILQSKLATIIEEDAEGFLLTPFNELTVESGSGGKQRIKVSRYFKSEFSLRELYELVVTGFSTKGGFAVAGLIRN
uniref:Uncharacterized protein n=1 Tax=Kalanchoe fedtschenkoi TaxID=63787 RepID=A0A7N0TEY6_KALFE